MKTFLKTIIVLCVLAIGTVLVMRVLYPQKYTDYVEKYSAEYDVPQDLIYAVIKCESGFNPKAESNIGALGLMQITPETFDWAQSKLDGSVNLDDSKLYDEETNIKYGVYLLRLHLTEFEDERVALAAYHAGRGQVNNWLNDTDVSSDGKTIDEIPYSDTKSYVDKVVATKKIYFNIY